MGEGFATGWTAPGAAMLHQESMTRGVLARRFAAFLLDGALVAAVCCLAWVVLMAFGVLTLGLGLPLLGLLPTVPFLYTWLFVASGAAATPGQAILGLTVRRDVDLARPTLLEALVWTVGFIVTLSLGAVWFGIALLTDRHRALHDLVSGLVVVRRRALEESLTAPDAVWDAPREGPHYV